jgi:hypothetical protein
MPALLAVSLGPDIPLDRGVVMVGRHPECDVLLDSLRFSRRHCVITAEGQDGHPRPGKHQRDLDQWPPGGGGPDPPGRRGRDRPRALLPGGGPDAPHDRGRHAIPPRGRIVPLEFVERLKACLLRASVGSTDASRCISDIVPLQYFKFAQILPRR